jgi:uncharacterized protein YaaR (DUF327 family)
MLEEQMIKKILKNGRVIEKTKSGKTRTFKNIKAYKNAMKGFHASKGGKK